MKNVKPYMLKNCIFLTTEQYDSIIKELFGEDATTEYSMDGISIGYQEETDSHYITTEDLHQKLAEYFDVTCVTSTHMDDCDEIGVWIVYTDTESR